MLELVCLEEREWWNLCERGYIRLLISRVVPWDERASAGELNKLFAVAPNVRLESSDSLVVSLLRPDWRSSALSRPDATQGDVVDLPISAVKSFHPVRETDRDLLLAPPKGVAFRLGAAIFAGAWEHWLITESVRNKTRAGFDLAALVGVPMEGGGTEHERKWERLTLLLLRPEASTADEGVLVERFLKLHHEVFEIAQEDHDTPAYRVSAPVEWVNACLGIDLQTVRPGLYNHLAEVWRALRSFTEEAPPPELVERADEALRDLRGSMPEAFSDELTPQFISIFLKIFHRAKSRIDSPPEILDAIRTVQHSSGIESARLAAFLLAAELGPEKISQLRQFLTAGVASGITTQPSVAGGSKSEAPDSQGASVAAKEVNPGAESPADRRDSPEAPNPVTGG